MSDFTKTLIVDKDGNGDYTTIKQAVDALGTDGGCVIVEEENYTIDGTGNQTTIDVPSNCTIIGRGNVLITVTDNVELFKNEDYDSDDNDRITISGFKIHVNMTSGDYDKHLIDMKRVSNSVFEKLTITAVSGDVLSGYAAIKLQGISGHECKGNVISHCSIQNFSCGVYMYLYCQYNMIDNNVVKNNSSINIFLEQAHNNIISNNVLTNATTIGLRIYKSDYNSTIGNEVYDNTTQGIAIDQSEGCTIQGNVCYENDDDGIRVTGTSLDIAQYNTIVGNSCYQNKGNSQNGIYLKDYSEHNAVNGNICYDNAGDGIKEDSEGGGAAKNLLVGNICYENDNAQITIGSGTNSIVANNMKN